MKLKGLESLEMDRDAETNGAWVDLPLGDGSRVKLRGGMSPRALNFRQRLLKKYRALYRIDQNPSAEQTERDEIEILAKILLVDWEGPAFMTEAGTLLPCNEETTTALLTEYTLLRRLLTAMADEVGHAGMGKGETDALGKTLGTRSASTSEPETAA